jgi:THO complex subunit 1
VFKIRWKNDLCPPFDKEPIQPSLEEQTREKRQKLMEPQPPWRYRWGTEALTELWETGFHGLSDCTDVPRLDFPAFLTFVCESLIFFAFIPTAWKA